MMCDRFKCLPREGGILDQPAAVIPRLSVVWEIIDAEQERQAKKGSQD